MSGDLEVRAKLRRSDAFQLDIAVSVAAGHTVALLGPNGSGKSTAVAAIAGLLPIDEGMIGLGGRVLDEPATGTFIPAERRRIGVVFQDYLLFPHLSVLENVAFGLRSNGVGRDEAYRRSMTWIDRLGLVGLGHRRPGDLSGGQAQRVALARALVTEPAALLLDEPLSALDVTTRTEMRHVMTEHLAVFSGPRLLITHDPTEAFLLADRVHIIEEGAITQAGSPDEIRLHPRTPYAADLAGSNLLLGSAVNGVLKVGEHVLHIADDVPDGLVMATIHPTAVSVHTRRPEGSARNSWATTIDGVEHLGTRARLHTAAPLPLTVEVTEAALADLGLEPGSRVWIAVKATEIGVQAEPGEYRHLPLGNEGRSF